MVVVLGAGSTRAQLSLNTDGHVGIGTEPASTILTVKDTLHISGDVPTLYLRGGKEAGLNFLGNVDIGSGVWATRLRGDAGLRLATSSGDVLTISGSSSTFSGSVSAQSVSSTGLVSAKTVSATESLSTTGSVTAERVSATGSVSGRTVTATESLVTAGPMTAGSLFMTTDPGNPSASGSWSWLWWDHGTKKILRGSSSRRYKEDIRPLQADYRALLRVQPRTYRYKGSGAQGVGYIAEELDELGMRDMVAYDSEKRPDAIHYPFLILYATEILKDHDRDLETIKADNTTLRNELAALRAEVEALRGTLAPRGRK